MSGKNLQSGYIALILVVSISSVLLAVLGVIAGNAVTHRLNIAITEEKMQSKYLSESCAYFALVQIAYNKTYPGNEILQRNSGQCSIEPIPPPAGNQLFIKTFAVLNSHQSSAAVIADAVNLSIISWQIQ